MAKTKKKSVDVRSKKDVAEFEKTLSLGPITLVLVYADWCGHCKHFKEDIWTDLQNLPNKKVNLASVHYDQLANTSQKDAKINGYPSLLVIGNDKKPATFNDTNGEVTNALPDSRNKEMLETMVTSDPNTLPETLEQNTSVVETPIVVNNSNVPQTTLNFQPNTLEKRNEFNTEVMPPNTLSDRVVNNTMKNTINKEKTPQAGGSLLDTLIKIAQATAPAALLTGAAVYRTKSKSRKIKKSKKRMTRRR
jgi:thiol-disulfide isomerase/thioredoxin